MRAGGAARLCLPLLALAAMLALSWCELDPEAGALRPSPPSVVSGDEPHYLMVVNSILFDRDLDLEDDYGRVEEGGLEAGRRFRGVRLDHHTILVDERTGEQARWVDVFRWREPIECARGVERGCGGFARRSDRFPDLGAVVERSAHPIGFPLAVAGPLALAGVDQESVESATAGVVVLFAWLGLLFSRALGRRLGLAPGAATAAALLVGLASPYLAYSRSYFSEPAIALALVIALWALMAGRTVAAGIAVVGAMFIKPMFAVIGLAWVLVAVATGRTRMALHLALVIGVGGALLVGVNWWLARTPLVSGVSGWVGIAELAEAPRTLIDGRYGLFAFAPWAPISFAALVAALVGARGRRLREPLVWIAAPVMILLVLLALHRPLGSTCYGPRYWVPLLPWLALAAVKLVADASPRVQRPLAIALVAAAVAAASIAVSGALLHRQVWDAPPYAALSLLLGL